MGHVSVQVSWSRTFKAAGMNICDICLNVRMYICDICLFWWAQMNSSSSLNSQSTHNYDDLYHYWLFYLNFCLKNLENSLQGLAIMFMRQWCIWSKPTLRAPPFCIICIWCISFEVLLTSWPGCISLIMHGHVLKLQIPLTNEVVKDNGSLPACRSTLR